MNSPVVLVVDGDDSARFLVRVGLEIEGIPVIEATSVEAARKRLRKAGPAVCGVVLERDLPDGDGLELLAEIGAACPEAAIIVNSLVDDDREPAWIDKVAKGDVTAIARLVIAARGASPRDEADDTPDAPLAVVDLVRAEAESLAAQWIQRCRADPYLPPDCHPPAARRIVESIAEALAHPRQATSHEAAADPALAVATAFFARATAQPDVAIEELICLREVLRNRIDGHVPPAEERESRARVDTVLDRVMWGAVRARAATDASVSAR